MDKGPTIQSSEKGSGGGAGFRVQYNCGDNHEKKHRDKARKIRGSESG